MHRIAVPWTSSLRVDRLSYPTTNRKIGYSVLKKMYDNIYFSFREIVSNVNEIANKIWSFKTKKRNILERTITKEI